MRLKFLIYFLAFLVLFIALSPNLSNNAANYWPSLPSIEPCSGANLLVVMPNFRVLTHDFLRLSASHILYPATFKQPMVDTRFDLANQVILFCFSYIIVLFFIFYQIARTGRKEDAPVHLMVIKNH